MYKKPFNLKKYYTWDEIKTRLNLKDDYFDNTIHFETDNGGTYYEVWINSGRKYYRCTVNQFFEVYDYLFYFFNPLTESAPSEKEWDKIKRMSSKKIEKFLQKLTAA